ncbi:alpha/beta hydrolase [Caenimonas sedimenti]|uniref:Alpha/beta hydrolase n=1 Tax=Caenimonas sedimenti TaxID=2596921 RepID=A0A562ZW06_9BURK|nr:alpha/beta hydrolase [Caenimonas sedimenti]TWO72364.1 alpha/beta hydrolase [Caenimonas sedimenti]
MKIDIGGGVRLYVDIEGSGLVPEGASMREKPTLLCLHGGPGFDHSGFKPAFSQLADVAQVVYYDHRGHGRSDPRPPAEWTLDTWADDVVRLCDALGIAKPIVLGQSFGGMVAQKYLARHPGHPGKVVISSTSAQWVLERKLAMFERRGGAHARALAEAFWRNPGTGTFQAYWDGCHGLYNTRANADATGGTRMQARLDILFHFAGGEIRTMDLAPGLAQARCPVLVMAGEEDPVCPIADAEDIVAALPVQWTQFARFPGVGHGAWRDDPQGAFEVLKAFISRE